jgi:predicted DNA-binding transcriptional regulator AlpA
MANTEQKAESRLLSTVQVAARLGISVPTLWTMRKSKKFPVAELTINGRPRFDSADLEDWIESLKRPAA